MIVIKMVVLLHIEVDGGTMVVIVSTLTVSHLIMSTPTKHSLLR